MKKPKAEKLPSGNFRVRLQIDGHRYSVVATSPKKAQDKAMEIYLGFRVAKKTVMTVGKMIDEYIEERENTLSPYTIKGYKTIRKNYLQGIMDIPLDDLTQKDVQKAVLADEAAGKSAKTIRNAHGLFTAAVGEYRPDWVIRTKLPKKKTKSDIRLPTEEEMSKIWQAAKGDKYELPILLASWLGMRMSEVRGLKFSDISEDSIHIQRARIRVKGKDVEKEPKTTAGNRVVTIPRPIMTLIAKAANEVKNRSNWEDLYICDYSISAISRGFIRACKKAGVEPCRFHDLRHFAASEALALGIPDKYSMKRMGHATENMLKNVYQHTMKQKEEDFGKVIDDHLKMLYDVAGFSSQK